MKSIYRFTLDYGRHGFLSGVFSADDSDVEKIIGERIYFGEVLGKHSEVVATMEPKMFTLLTSDPDFVAKFDEYRLDNGYNPFDYREEQ